MLSPTADSSSSQRSSNHLVCLPEALVETGRQPPSSDLQVGKRLDTMLGALPSLWTSLSSMLVVLLALLLYTTLLFLALTLREVVLVFCHNIFTIQQSCN